MPPILMDEIHLNRAQIVLFCCHMLPQAMHVSKAEFGCIELQLQPPSSSQTATAAKVSVVRLNGKGRYLISHQVFQKVVCHHKSLTTYRKLLKQHTRWPARAALVAALHGVGQLDVATTNVNLLALGQALRLLQRCGVPEAVVKALKQQTNRAKLQHMPMLSAACSSSSSMQAARPSHPTSIADVMAIGDEPLPATLPAHPELLPQHQSKHSRYAFSTLPKTPSRRSAAASNKQQLAALQQWCTNPVQLDREELMGSLKTASWGKTQKSIDQFLGYIDRWVWDYLRWSLLAG